ncbi:regulating synaptic membrane exocytosis protein 2 [Anabrus simplex]|uniref:regulating synaptic membrane exocytosis protein 2 n=1 Tax=Anabrus simplex TaxID=316456 RepID=UPI0035A31131
MLPTNVMSFMKKMVTTNEPTAGTEQSAESGTALSKLRQTLSSSLMTAQDKVTTKLSPARQATPQDVVEATPTPTKVEEPVTPKSQKPPCRIGTCRVCLKSFKPDDFFRTCCECQQRVCEDCASYSKLEENQDESTWRCSICRRKMQSRAQPVVQQDSTDSLLDIPVLEALQRRHSDVKIGSSSLNVSGGGVTSGLGAGLAPPRSPELRRHSDVSPASLKELEKVAGERREELRWERELEWRHHKRGGGGSPGGSRVSSPQVERRPFDDRNWDPRLKPDGNEHNERGRPSTGDALNPEEQEDAEAWRRHRGRTRRKSRVTRQHSYDDELKNAAGATATSTSGGGGGGEGGLGLPVQLPRRASAYDVYATRGGDGGSGGSGLNALAMAAAVAAVSRQQQPSPQQQVSRYGNGAIADPDDAPSQASIAPGTTGRRPSFRAVKTPAMYDRDDTEGSAGFDNTPSPLSPDSSSQPPSLGVDDDRRTRRRGSQLPDLAGRALPLTPPGSSPSSRSSAPPRQLEDLCADSVRRQASVTDGESIKIVIHDVDSEANFNARPGAKRRVVLRRDPSDKAHRSEAWTRGFGMRVVGGKTGNDGRLFAYIVWTVPGGPAEKGGLQQGDKVLEWDGVPLVDKSFEEVCSVMDRAGEKVELLVEHGTDLRMCDLLDDPNAMMPGSRKGGENMGMAQETEPEKAPPSPTRRKLPKTPEQIAREKAVSGRVQLQVFYHDEKQELVVSVLAADDLALREDTGYGTQPEAYVKLRLMPISGEHCMAKTNVAEPTHNPMWNATLDFPNVPGESLMERTIEATLWDYCPDRESVFLGECTVDLQKAFLEDRPVWYRLEDPRGLRMAKSPQVSPRGSLAGEMAQRMIRRAEFGSQRSFSDDRNVDEKPGSPEPSLLHPDHAWFALSGCSSRRGSSQSEQLEVETYQLGRDFSRSLPGSRRSSFQSAQTSDKDPEMPPPGYNKERRRSSCARVMRDPDEILRNLKAVRGELMMGRTTSLTGDKGRRRKDRKDSMLDLLEQGIGCGSPSDEDDRWSWVALSSLPTQPAQGTRNRQTPSWLSPPNSAMCLCLITGVDITYDDHFILTELHKSGSSIRKVTRVQDRSTSRPSLLVLAYVHHPDDLEALVTTGVTINGRLHAVEYPPDSIYQQLHYDPSAIPSIFSHHFILPQPPLPPPTIITSTLITTTTTTSTITTSANITPSLQEVQLGPGQIQPRGYRLSSGRHGEVYLGLLMTKGQLEVEVMTARNIACEERETSPDTYVKTYLRDGDRWLQKRKTRVIRHCFEPQFNQTLRYSACDVLGRTLLVMLWEYQKGFEHNQGLGGAEVALDKLQLTQHTSGWYPLFPMHSLGSDSNDSP